MSNIGYATLSIIPSMRGLESQLRGQLSSVGPVGEKAGAVAGQSFASRFAGVASGVVRNVGGALVDGMRTAAVTAGTGAAAALGVSLVTGFKRLTTIQDATAALTVSLGDAAKAGDLLGQVLEVVKGTPFPLDQFAAAAQQMAGFGIDSAKIPGILTAIGDASATQGKRATEFAGRLTDAFGQMAAKGQVDLESIWRISETGVNALAILANHFGVTTTAMKDMISKGAVPAQEAIDALTKGIEQGTTGVAGTTVALKGTMEALGNTVSGSLANMKTAFARFGATLLGPFSESMVKAFNAVTGVLDNLGKAIGPTLAKFANSEGFQRFIGWLQTLPDKVGPVVDKLRELKPALAPIAGILAALATQSGPLSALLPSINPVVGALAGMAAISPELRDAFKDVFDTLKPLVLTLGTELSRAVQTLIPGLRPLIEALGPALAPVFAALGPLAQTLATALAQVATAAAPLLGALGQLVAALAPILGMVVELAGAFLSALLPALTPLVEVLAQVVSQIATALQPVIAQIIPIIQENAQVFAEFVTALLPLLPALGDLLVALLPILPPLIELATLQVRLAAVMLPVITVVAELAAILITGLAGAINAVVGFLKNDLKPTLREIPAAFGDVLEAIGRFAGDVFRFFRDLPGNIVKAIGDLGHVLFDSGRDLVQGFIEGIKSKSSEIGKWLVNPIAAATDKVDQFLHRGSPSKLYMAIGADVGEGFLLGVKSMQGRIDSAMLSAFSPAALGSPAALAPVSLPPDLRAVGTDGDALGGDIVIQPKLIVGDREMNIATADTRVAVDRWRRRSRY